MGTIFNFNSQVCSNIEQSRRLLALGLKKETADMIHVDYGGGNYMIRPYDWLPTSEVDMEKYIPAWSLHRLIEVLDTNPCVFYTNCGYDNIIDRIEDYIKEGLIDTRYLEEWCLDEEE